MIEEKIKKLSSGKDSNDENFPVGSILIKKELRKVVFDYYKFARTADDIADSPEIDSQEKLDLLDELENNLIGSSKAKEEIKFAVNLREEFKKRKIDIKHATDLLIAFKQDAKKTEYQTWSELINYCRFSAAPVGRFLLDLHEEGLSTHWCGDRLCAALQILNHLQDIKKDLKNINRVYMPIEYMEKFEITRDDFLKESSSENVRKLIDEMIKGTDGLIYESKTLRRITKNIGLRMEICIITKLAEILSERLKQQDPIKEKVKLTKIDWIKAVFLGIIRAIFTIRMTTENEKKHGRL